MASRYLLVPVNVDYREDVMFAYAEHVATLLEATARADGLRTLVANLRKDLPTTKIKILIFSTTEL